MAFDLTQRAFDQLRSKPTFMQLQDQIGWRNCDLARFMDLDRHYVSRLRSGRQPMSRRIELVMLALASGWRP